MYKMFFWLCAGWWLKIVVDNINEAIDYYYETESALRETAGILRGSDVDPLAPQWET